MDILKKNILHKSNTLGHIDNTVTPSMQEFEEDKQPMQSERTEYSYQNEEPSDFRANSGFAKTLRERLDLKNGLEEDLNEENLLKKMEQVWKFGKWKVKKWLNKYKRY